MANTDALQEYVEEYGLEQACWARIRACLCHTVLCFPANNATVLDVKLVCPQLVHSISCLVSLPSCEVLRYSLMRKASPDDLIVCDGLDQEGVGQGDPYRVEAHGGDDGLDFAPGQEFYPRQAGQIEDFRWPSADETHRASTSSSCPPARRANILNVNLPSWYRRGALGTINGIDKVWDIDEVGQQYQTSGSIRGKTWTRCGSRSATSGPGASRGTRGTAAAMTHSHSRFLFS